MEKIMPKKILILGSKGMLGHMLFYNLSIYENFKIYNFSHKIKLNSKSINCNVFDILDLEKKIKKIKPDVIINCIGIIIQNIENKVSDSIYVNAFFPNKLKEIVRPFKTKIIHISTDCVFNGKKGNYSEKDIPNETNIYGLSKFLGEINEKPHLTIRTSIIGPEINSEGRGLMHWIFMQSGKIKGYDKVLWGGVTTLELSKVIYHCIKNNIYGLFHVTNGEPISKYELLKIIKEKFNLVKVKIKPYSEIISDKSLKSIRNDISYKVPSYYKMISDLYEFYKKNKGLYKYNL
tara:strand:+ start:11 stop:883 length:873 start_codon:yes stop_codon:yes gene_type:complete